MAARSDGAVIGMGDCEGPAGGGNVEAGAMGALELALRVDERVAGGSVEMASRNDFFFVFLSDIVVVCDESGRMKAHIISLHALLASVARTVLGPSS